MATKVPQRLTAAEIRELPAYQTCMWKLKPSQSGRLAVAKGRGGPFDISWEVHGTGKTKLVWIMGLGAIKTAWQRTTLQFGHNLGAKYSVLIFDNRGMGESDVPVMRYSTSEMAKDVLELVDNLGWTEERQLHVMGVSMGGMIAQEFGGLCPDRIASLILTSTCARIENTVPFLENLKNRAMLFIPKSIDRAIIDAARNICSDRWLDSPDDCQLPNSSTPNAEIPPGGYGRFEINFQRFAAQEVWKRAHPDIFTRTGFMLQAIAAGWHHKSAEQLKKLGDEVERERIMVLHGTLDHMITVHHGEVLIKELEPAHGIIREGYGHALAIESWDWYNKTVEKHLLACAKLS